MGGDFDIGPLTWVRGEIDQALERSKTALRAYAANPADSTQIKFSQSHFHQAHGALQIVGLDGVTRLSEDLEGLLAEMEKAGGAPSAEAIKAAESAFGAISAYLDRLLQGEPNQPLVLFAVYRDLVAVRGKGQADPIDLYFPDLSRRPQRREKPLTPLATAESAVAFYREARGRYQRGLLKWLKKDASGAEDMRAAVAAVEGAQTVAQQRAFWWVALGFFDALVARALPESPFVGRMANRVEQQIKRLAEGSVVVAERLMREVLFAVARARPATEHLREVHETYALAGSIPAAFELKSETAPQHPALKAMRDAVPSAKAAWNKVASGHQPSLGVFRNETVTLRERAKELGHASLADLAEELAGLAGWVGDDLGRVNDALAMEAATGLLLVENAVENFTRLAPEFALQAQTMRARLAACRQGTTPQAAPEVPLLDEMSRRAQERLLMAQVVGEIQANMRTIEQALDAFFRDATKRAELAGLEKPIRQVLGALTMLNEDRAAAALATSGRDIARFAHEHYAPAQEDFERVAGTLSGIGFYVDALQHGKPDFDAIMKPIGPRREVAQPEEAQAPLPSAATVEAGLDLGKRALPSLFDAWKAKPEDRVLKQALKAGLAAIQKDAGIVADSTLEAKAGEALAILATSGVLPIDPALVRSVSAIAPAITPAPSPEAAKLMEASAATVDAELLSIYLEEAGEVLATISSHLAEAREQPQNVELVRTIRRGFHTLKGSGRMVGLTRLGEAAWAVEQVMNKWLEEERPGTPEVFTLISAAHDFFEGAVAKLKDGGASADESAIVAMAQRVKAGEPVGEVPPVETVLAAAPVEPPPAELPPIEPAPIEIAPAEPPSLEEPTLTLAHAAPVDVAGAAPEVPVLEPLIPDFELPTLPVAMPVANEPAPVIDLSGEPAAMLADALPTLDFDLSGTPAAAPAPSAVELEEEVITIGEAQLSPTLFEIFLSEARTHLGTMQAAHAALAESGTVSDEFERAAHTLAGTAGTVKFDAMRELGHALEHCLERVLHQHVEPEGQLLIGQALATLETMVAAAASQESPRAAPDLVARLDTHQPRQMPGAVSAPQATETPSESAPAADLLPDLDLTTFETAGFHPEPPSAPAPEVLGDLDLTDFAPLRAPAETVTLEAALPLVLAEPPAAEQPIERFAVIAPVGTDTPVVAAPPFESVPEPALEPASNVVAFPVSPEEPVEASAASVEVEEIPVERRTRRIDDDIDPQLLPIFMEEAQELVPAVGQTLRDWFEHPENAAAGHALQRVLHTLKGSARMCGAMALGEVTHSMETRVENALTMDTLPRSLFEGLETSYDRMGLLFDRLQNPEAHPEPLLAEAELEEYAPDAATLAAAAPAAAPAPVPHAVEAPAQPKPEAEAAVQTRAMLRVRADMVDRLVNEAGEVSIARSRIEGEMRSLKATLLDLTENVNRLRMQLREIEIAAESQMQSRMTLSQEKETAFDPLEFDRFTRFQELTRMMAESVNDVSTVQQNVLKALGDSDAALLAQARITRELQNNLMRVRMVPFASISERLFRVVRQAAKDSGKRAVLDIRGGQVELDRSVLERITAPFEHMLRNSVAHGIEPTADRISRGKTELGEIKIEVRQEGNEVTLAVNDDGAGVDLERVREQAASLGLIAPADVLNDSEIADFIFHPGFSTAEEVTQLAGRGVGMDVVKSEITALGGRVETHTERGRGTTFTIYLPLTLAVTQAVLVRAAGAKYAIPAAMIEQVRQIKQKELDDMTAAGRAVWQDREYSFQYLPRMLGQQAFTPEPKRVTPVLFLRSGSNVVAIQVDELFGTQEIVVKNTGPLLARVAGITGATVLGSGEILLIINPVILGSRELVVGHAPVAAVEEAPAPAVPTVMIVDDSLTVRKITGRLLAREGYNVVTAKDGVDALEQLQELLPDVMLVDIEMPRMDGFDLTRNVRADRRLKKVPIIMITSRTADKHRAYAKEIGVNAYLGKPFQEEELLGYIADFVKRAVPA